MRPIFIIHNNTHCDEILADKISTHMGFEIREINVENLDYISKLVEDEDAALLIIGINTNKEIQFYLDKCRDLRIPYIFVKNNITADFKIDTILLPITNLEEEKEKGQTDTNTGKIGDMRAMFFTYEDSKGEQQISSVYVDFWSQSAYGDIFNHACPSGSNKNDFISTYDPSMALKLK